MYNIECSNVNYAMEKGLKLLSRSGDKVESRNGDTLEMNAPVCTTYQFPWEKVLFGNVRDANPFFHFFESLWILKGRDDVKFLNEFNKGMVNYSDDGVVFNAPYGFRMRNSTNGEDQIQSVINILRADPNSRQAVMQIWDPEDLNKKTLDKACNMSVVFRMRDNKLTMTVYNRSNDMIWGAYGANVVQFSMLQEYVAMQLGCKIGEYHQISNAFHVYTTGKGGDKYNELLAKYKASTIYNNLMRRDLVLMGNDPIYFDDDLDTFFKLYDRVGMQATTYEPYDSRYFNELVIPMWNTIIAHKTKQDPTYDLNKIKALDWKYACDDWLIKRNKNANK